jgi:hypothetical protein
MAVPRSLGGWGLGTAWVTVITTAAILLFVAYLSIANKRLATDDPARREHVSAVIGNHGDAECLPARSTVNVLQSDC